MTKRLILAAGACLWLTLPAITFASSVPGLTSGTESEVKADRYVVATNLNNTIQNDLIEDEFKIFTPGPKTKSTRIDYTVWDQALERVVLDLGPSLRVRAPKPAASSGTRRVLGHKSAYRLEGTRFTFAYLTDSYKQGLTDYRKDLETVGTEIELTSLSRDEQLAYWLNLHNVAVLDQIAQAYPMQRPERVKINIDGKRVPLDEAKFITVKGVKMSPKDIRTQIVYPNWDDADVIYGFYRGDIGSPILPRYAYDAQNLSYTLSDNGYEFVNSLRGFHESYSNRKISAIYDEARPYFFNNWESDLQSHLLKHANAEVEQEVLSGKPFKIDRYDSMVADLSGGRRLGSSGLSTSGQIAMSAETERLLREARQKELILRREGLIGNQPRGWVIIEDLYDEPAAADAPTISEQEAEDTAE